MNMPTIRGRVAAALLALLLAACGGGDGDATSGETTTMPVAQGNLVATNRSLDLAIIGAGLFAFVDADGAAVYSRSGQLDVDRDGRLVHAEGWRLAGRASAAAPGDRATALPALPYTLAGDASTKVRIEANLDSRQSLIPPWIAFALEDPSTYNAATSVTLHDAQGRPAWLNFVFVHVEASRWDVYGVAGGTLSLGRVAQLGFDLAGRFDTAASTTPPIDIPPLDSMPSGPTQAIPGIVVDWSGVSDLGTSFAVSTLDSDGYPPGRLQEVQVDRDGQVAARYDNGQQRPAGQLLLARFALGDRLQRVGTGGLRCVRDCAAPIVAPAREMLLGEVASGALEERP